jgi:hypothetical protein
MERLKINKELIEVKQKTNEALRREIEFKERNQEFLPTDEIFLGLLEMIGEKLEKDYGTNTEMSMNITRELGLRIANFSIYLLEKMRLERMGKKEKKIKKQRR